MNVTIQHVELCSPSFSPQNQSYLGELPISSQLTSRPEVHISCQFAIDRDENRSCQPTKILFPQLVLVAQFAWSRQTVTPPPNSSVSSHRFFIIPLFQIENVEMRKNGMKKKKKNTMFFFLPVSLLLHPIPFPHLSFLHWCDPATHLHFSFHMCYLFLSSHPVFFSRPVSSHCHTFLLDLQIVWHQIFLSKMSSANQEENEEDYCTACLNFLNERKNPPSCQHYYCVVCFYCEWKNKMLHLLHRPFQCWLREEPTVWSVMCRFTR